MKIHALELTNVRGVDHLELRDLPDSGVIIIHGENEAGKSTILDALHAVLNEGHKAKNKVIRPLKPVHRDAAPEVRLEATIGPWRLTIFKRWFSKPASELTLSGPRHANYTGREADDQLARIIDEHLDSALVETFFMRQGQQPHSIEAVGIPSMTRALDAASGGGEDGTEDSLLMQRVEQAYLEYFTPGGRPVKLVTDAEARVNEAQNNLEHAESEAAQLASYVDEVARKQEELTQAREDLPAAEADVKKFAAEVEVAAKAQDKEQAAAELVRTTQAAVARSQEEVKRREALIERLAVARKEHEALKVQLTDAERAAGEERDKREELTRARDAAQQKVLSAREKVKQASATRELVLSFSRLKEVDDLLARLDAAGKEVATARAAMPEKVISDEDVRALEAAENDVALQRRLRDAAAARLVVSNPGGEAIDIAGKPHDVAAGDEVELFDDTVISIGDFQATYRSARGATDSSAELAEAEETFRELCEDLGVTDVKHARDVRDEHRAQAVALRDVKEKLAALTGQSSAQELRKEATRLRARVGEKARPEANQEEAHDAVELAQRDADEKEAHLARAIAELEPWKTGRAATELEVVKARIEAAANTVDVARDELELAEKTMSHEEVLSQLERARTEAERARAALAEAREAVEQAQPDVTRNLLAGAQARVDNLKSREREAELRTVQLQGYIEQAEGIAERVDVLRTEQVAAHNEYERIQRRAAAVQLLRSTLNEHREAAQRKYAEPFAQALGAYAGVVFGRDVRFELDEKLRVQARTLGDVTVDVANLSGGAQEQLAVLTRFAIADLAAQDSSSAPVIVDDALGATDPTRLNLMNTLFTQAGKSTQVLVLTCFPQRYDTIGASARFSVDELKLRAAHRE